MTTLPDGEKGWSPLAALRRWLRDWSTSNAEAELRCCSEEAVERIARDVGVSTSELHQLASEGPGASDLLLRRMAALDLDKTELAKFEPETLHDLQRVCSVCQSKRKCTNDLNHDQNDPAWKDYCPNVATLMALNAMPWGSRREW